ncbi:MAG: Uma2 family endonuclease [Pyrinomonadaceae bacterium]|nr:Uma2 family endonuclease [Pyrinomonadaceae bacterium]
MFEIETRQPTNRVITQLLHNLADEGFVNIINDEDEEMSETTLHFELINVFFNTLKLFFKERENVFVAANLRVTYDIENSLKWFAPDVLVAFGVEKRERRSYYLPHEKVMPQVVFEVASEKTVDVDLGKKYAEYSRLGVEEYYLLDPERTFLPVPFMAFQLQNGKLSPASISDTRIFSPRLELEIVDTNETFRLFDPKTNEFLLSPQELAIQNYELKARIAELEASFTNGNKK